MDAKITLQFDHLLRRHLASKGGRSVGAEDLALSLWDQRQTSADWVLQVLSNHLRHVSSSKLVVWHDGSLQDLDGGSLSSVTSSHLGVHLSDGLVDGQGSV